MRDLDPSTGQTTARRNRTGTALLALGAWTVAIPYIARPLGLGVDVASRIEIVDHVVPGALVAGLGAWLARRPPQAPGMADLVAAGVCFLAGFWVLATHVPLVADAARGSESWGAAVWHASTAPVIVVLTLITIFRSGPAASGGA